MEKTRMLKLSELVFDYSIYPRSDIDSQHVRYMREAERAGVKFPPYVIDRKSRRVVDGFHRGKKDMAEHGPGHEVECVEKDYTNEGEIFIDSMRLNANHGRSLTQHDRARCTIMAKRFKISILVVASALGMTPAAIKDLGTGRIASRPGRNESGDAVPLKRTIRHLAGTTLTEEQIIANDKLSGMEQVFYARQLLLLLENGLLDRENSTLMGVLMKLKDALDKELCSFADCRDFEGSGVTESVGTVCNDGSEE